jgi:PAS domain S-box-containing protein
MVMGAQRQATILNVDDYGPARYSRTRVLRGAGYDVIEASTGAEALELLDKHRPQLVILDVHLPDVSGLDVCREIKKNPETAHVLVVHLSASFVGVESKVAGLSGGCDGYLTEPLHPAELVAQVAALLRLKRAEEGYRDSNATLNALVDASPLAIVATDVDGQVTRWSPAAQRMLGWTEQEVIGQQDPSIPGHVALENGSLASAPAVGVESERLCRDGRLIPVAVSTGPVMSAEGRAIGRLAVIENISGRKDAERRIERLYAEADRANRVKDEFLAMLSHELRTPLNAMSLWLQMLRQGSLSPDRIDHALEIIERNTKAQVRLIEDILDISRIVSGKLQLHMAPVDLGRVIGAAAELVRPLTATRSQTLQVLVPETPVVVRGDAARLQQVVNNLLSNSVKFTPSGGHISVRLRASDGEAIIEVADTGTGIDPAFLPHVFERFFQADSSSSRSHGGLGLGLAIVSYVVGAHDGRVSAESEGRGKGSTLRVALKLIDDPVETAAAQEESVSVDLTGTHILVVDDEQDTRDSLQLLLSTRGARVRVAASATEALESYRAEPPDIIISDLGMPDEDGYVLMERIRALDPNRPIFAVALSGYVGDDDRQRSHRAGYQHHLAKPPDLSRLVATLAKAPRRV